MSKVLDKYHWEFLRRNKKYQEAWSQLNELTREASYRDRFDEYQEFFEEWRNFVKREQEENSGHNEVREKEDRLFEAVWLVRGEEKAFARTWNVLPTDPILNYNEILERKLDYRISYRPVSIAHHKGFPDVIRFDINMNVSKERILKEFRRILDEMHPLFHRLGIVEKPSHDKTKRLQLNLYDAYLQVYDLKESGKSFAEIGAELFEDDYEIPEPIQRAKDCYRAAKRLVEQGLP